MKFALPAGIFCGALALAASLGFVHREVSAASKRLAEPARKDPALQAAVADHTEAPYCTPQFKEVLQRVINACGPRRPGVPSRLPARRRQDPGQHQRRRFQRPVHAAGPAGGDPALRRRLREAGRGREEAAGGALGGPARRSLFLRRRPGVEERHRGDEPGAVPQAGELGAVLPAGALQGARPGAGQEDRLLWLGKEFAQLTKSYCADWAHSHTGKPCNEEAINRSAFISWVDCRL
jgi:hypothetical protein